MYSRVVKLNFKDYVGENVIIYIADGSKYAAKLKRVDGGWLFFDEKDNKLLAFREDAVIAMRIM
jgi:hypothetical protein